MIEVRYAGVVIGRSAIIRELDTRGLFLGVTEPLPVGTPVVLRIGDRPGDDDVKGKVAAVSEAQELSHAGMRIRFDDPGAANRFGNPAQAAPEPDPEPAPAPRSQAAVSSPTAGPESGAVRAAGTAAPGGSFGSGAVQRTADASVSAAASGPRRIVVDASADRQRAATAPAASLEEEDDGPGQDGGQDGNKDGRIPAPDPSAFSGGQGGQGGKKGRRNRRR